MTMEALRAADNVKPTLTDEEVLEFCKTGILTLEGVIPDSTNRWVFEYLDEEGADPHQLVRDERFIDEVLLHPAVAGVIRSLLGANLQLPEWMANHRLVGPVEANYWHIDAGSDFERACNLLQVFYIPQLNSMEMGPDPVPARLPPCTHCQGGHRALWQSDRSGSDHGDRRIGVRHSLFDLASSARQGRSIDAQPVEVGILAHNAAGARLDLSRRF